jgi:hypothetical protein
MKAKLSEHNAQNPQNERSRRPPSPGPVIGISLTRHTVLKAYRELAGQRTAGRP